MVLRFVSLSFCYVKGRERRSKPVSFSLLEKERFLESKEKGAPEWVEWSQIGIRRPGFTPPLWTSPVHRRLRRWNREKPWFYPTFFRRLRGWVSGRGDAAWIPAAATWVALIAMWARIAAWVSGRLSLFPRNKAGAAGGSARFTFLTGLPCRYRAQALLSATRVRAIPKFFLILFLSRKRIRAFGGGEQPGSRPCGPGGHCSPGRQRGRPRRCGRWRRPAAPSGRRWRGTRAWPFP